MNFPPPSPKQANVIWFCLTSIVVAAVIALVGLVLWGFGLVINLLTPVILPLALAGILAYLLDPVVDFIEKKRVPRIRAIVLVFFMAIMMFVTLLTTVVPAIVVQSQKLIQDAPNDVKKLRLRIDEWQVNSPIGRKLSTLWNAGLRDALGTNSSPSSLTNRTAAASTTPSVPAVSESTPTKPISLLTDTIAPWIANTIPTVFDWITNQLTRLASWVGLLAGLALVPVYVFYFLIEKKGINEHWTEYLPINESRIKEELIFVLTAINDCLIVFFRGQVLVAMCIGTLLAIGYSMVGLHYALLLGLMAGVLGIIPYLGAIMSLIPALAIAVVQFGTWWHPLLVLGVYACVQMAEGLFISPKIIGDRVGLHPLTVIVAVLVGTSLLGGIIGGVLAIPLTAALRTLMFRYIWKKPT